MTFLDAHNHLHDARLAPYRDVFLAELERLPIGGGVVNGTKEDDWAEVREMAIQHPWVVPSYGLHPWFVLRRSEVWLSTLRDLLMQDPRAAVGEIGLDRWIEGHDLEVQRPVFLDQLRLAAELSRPATIHCVQAWGALREALQGATIPARGFLLHAYGGPVEMIDDFVEQGAYFSFSPYFLHERKKLQREAFIRIPAERLLVETDAPDLRPPDEANPRRILDRAGKSVNHPANIDVAYRGLAELREVSLSHLAPMVAENYARLFLLV